MAKTREQKKEIVKFYKKNLDESTGVIFADNPGLTANEVVDLKKKLSDVQAHFHILSNRLFKLAVTEKLSEKEQEMLVGPTTAIFTSGEITESAKILKEFSKETNNKPTLKGGLLANVFINAEKTAQLADLPSKEELIAKTVYMFNSPLSGFANVLSGNIRNLVYALNAIKEKKQ